jgi:hypothetical protein
MRKQSIVNFLYALDAAKNYRIKATLGITGWLCLSVHSDGTVRHLDVGSTYPGGGEASKGMAVRHLKSYASWVQTVVRQVGLLSTAVVRFLRGFAPSTRGPE